MKNKKFTIEIKGDITESQLSDVIYNGFQFYDEIQWEKYNVKEIKENEKKTQG